jgi:Putative bacterial sensory transduction regulator
MVRFARWFTAGLFLTALGSSGESQPIEIITEAPPTKIQSILQGMGFEFTGEPCGGDLHCFLFQLDGYKVALLSDTKSLQHLGRLSIKADSAKVNEWNQQIKYGRAYLKDGELWVEDTIALEGGVTRTNVQVFIIRFRTILQTAETFFR